MGWIIAIVIIVATIMYTTVLFNKNETIEEQRIQIEYLKELLKRSTFRIVSIDSKEEENK